MPSHYIKGQKYVLLSHRENLSMEGRNSLKTLLAANRRLNIAYLLKESFWQLWDYEREGWARRFFENVTTFIASSSPPGVARELSRLRRPRPPSQSEGGCLNESR